jgi:uncharacterized protein with von Willebrand factor type A (vWA) domain
MSVKAVDVKVAQVEQTVLEQFQPLFSQCSALQRQLKDKTMLWQNDALHYLQTKNPYRSFQQELANWQANQKQPALITSTLVKSYQKFCLGAKLPFDDKFWADQLEVAQQDQAAALLAKQLLCNDWQKKLDQTINSWYSEQLSKLSDVLRDELDDWLKALTRFQTRLSQLNSVSATWLNRLIAQLSGKNVVHMTQWCEVLAQLSEQLDSLGLEPDIWLHSSIDNLDIASLQTLQQWATYLTRDVGAQKVADMLGRMSQAEWSEQVAVVKQSISLRTPVIDLNSKEEIIGLRLGKDLEHALPSELALMADPDTAILFYLKYLESKLVCFELQGQAYQDEITEIDVETTQQAEDAKGPMILCIDTSGSMAGEPEDMAKAMALYLGTKALAEKRPCYVINFSNAINTFEVNAQNGLPDLIQFLQSSFHGGTDAAPALCHALEMLKQNNYLKADVLMVSDFIMQKLPTALLSEIQAQKELGSRFNSLVIGDVFLTDRLKTLFDKEWVYDPYSHKVHEVIGFAKDVATGLRA